MYDQVARSLSRSSSQAGHCLCSSLLQYSPASIRSSFTLLANAGVSCDETEVDGIDLVQRGQSTEEAAVASDPKS